MQALDTALDAIRVGDAITLDNLTMFPFFGTAAPADYLTLDEAIAKGLTRVSEISEHGSVPELKLLNEASQPVLLLDGEELVGAKQNRIVNLTIMVAGRSETVIPVSCVEAGRWSARTAYFSTGQRAFFSRGRAAKAAQVNASMSMNGSRRSDQSAVWEAIAEKSERMQADSATRAAAAMYENHANALERFIASLTPVPGQTGAAFAINGELIGLDLFDAPDTFAKQLRKLVSSYALDAIDERAGVTKSVTVEDCGRLLQRARQAQRSEFKSVGMGEDVRLDATDLKGGALVVDGKVVHLCAFLADSCNERLRSTMWVSGRD